MPRLTDHPAFRYAAAGAIATAADIGTYSLLLRAGTALRLAAAAGPAVGFAVGYLLNSRYTFAHATQATLAKYFAVFLSGLAISVEMIAFLVGRSGVHPLAAKLAAVLVVFAWGFALNSRWTFKK